MIAHLKSITIIAVLGMSASAFAATPPTVFEDFSTNSDSRWIGVSNRGPASDNFGWSNTDNTGNSVNAPTHAASVGGELGGIIHRGTTTAQYGFNVGAITSSDVLHADGVFRWTGANSGQFYMGFYNSTDHGTTVLAGGDPRNFIGIEFDDSHKVLQFVANSFSSHRENHSPADALPSERAIAWSMDYDGNGKLVTVVDGITLSNDAGSGYFISPASLDRFGLFPSASGDSNGLGYFDDIAFSSLNPIPEPASLGALSICGLALIRRHRRRVE